MAELRHQMEIGFARIDTRFEAMGTRFEAMGRTFESELRKQTRFFFLAWAVILAAIVGLYGR